MSYKFLIVDDTKFMRNMLRDILQQSGYEVIGEAENGVQAVEQYRELQPEVVMMDITMPEKDGIQALKEIRQINDKAVVLICSAMSQQDLISDALEAGANGYVMKPFKPNRVKEIIEKYAAPHLQEQRAARQKELLEEKAAALRAEKAAAEAAEAEAAAQAAAAELVAAEEASAVEAKQVKSVKVIAMKGTSRAAELARAKSKTEETEQEPMTAVEPTAVESIEERELQQSAEVSAALEAAEAADQKSREEESVAAEFVVEQASSIEAAEEPAIVASEEAQKQDEAVHSLEEAGNSPSFGELDKTNTMNPLPSALQVEVAPVLEEAALLQSDDLAPVLQVDEDKEILSNGINETEHTLNPFELDIIAKEKEIEETEEEELEPSIPDAAVHRDQAATLRAMRASSDNIIKLFRGKEPVRNFSSSYMCNWNDEMDGQQASYLVICMESDHSLTLEMTGADNSKQQVKMTLDAFRQLHAWLEEKIPSGSSNVKELSKKAEL